MLPLAAQIIILLYLAWEDWRVRSVPIWALAVFALLGWWSIGFRPDGEALLFNFTFLILQFSLLTAYFALRGRDYRHVAGGMLGWGDIAFVLLCATYQSPTVFLLGYLTGLTGTLLTVLLTGAYRKSTFSIPLITGLAGGWIVSLVLHLFYF